MTDEPNARTGWTVSISGEGGNPDVDRITVTRHDPPKIRLRCPSELSGKRLMCLPPAFILDCRNRFGRAGREG